jgi:hypothetical protein
MVGGRAGRASLAALAIAASLGVTGCVGATDRADFEAEIERRGGGVTSELVAQPLDRLREAIGVDDPELLLLSMTPLTRTVVLEVRDPAQRRNVDRYVSRGGGLDDPEPVQVSASDDLDARTFRPSELPALGDLEGLADQAIAALEFEDAYVDSMSVGLRNGEPVLSVHVTSPRSVGSAVFDGTGNLLGAAQQ